MVDKWKTRQRFILLGRRWNRNPRLSVLVAQWSTVAWWITKTRHYSSLWIRRLVNFQLLLVFIFVKFCYALQTAISLASFVLTKTKRLTKCLQPRTLSHTKVWTVMLKQHWILCMFEIQMFCRCNLGLEYSRRWGWKTLYLWNKQVGSLQDCKRWQGIWWV